MSRIYVFFEEHWIHSVILIYVLMLILSSISDQFYYSLSNILLLVLSIISLFVASSLEKLKVILFLGRNKNTITKAQILLIFFATITILLSMYNLDLLKSLSRWD